MGVNQSMSELLDKYKVLASYNCGSSIYGLEEDTSDKDITLIVEGTDIGDIKTIDNVDNFIFSPDYLIKIIAFDNSAFDTFKIWIDNLTLIKENLISLDESFKDEFYKIIDINWDDKYKEWLSLNIGYFKSRLEDGNFDKSLYHIYRLHSVVERYKSSGVFISKFNDKDLKLAENYKKNKSERYKHLDSLTKIIQYLEEQL